LPNRNDRYNKYREFLNRNHNFATVYRFHVELSINDTPIAGFSEVSGLSAEAEFEEYAEGGVNSFVHRFPSRIRYEPIVLRRGMTSSPILWEWFAKTIDGNVERKDGSIILYDEHFNELRVWDFQDAFPVKWIGPTLDASGSDLAIEQLEIVHNGIKLRTGNDNRGRR